MTTILGFDCSSSTIGYCALKLNEQTKAIKLLEANYLKPIKIGTIIERIADTRDKIQVIIKRIKPDQIAIEEIISFLAGKSTAQTIIMLTTFNRMIGLLSYDYLDKSPEMHSVMSIRHGLKINKIFPKKEEMPDLVAHHLGIAFPWEFNRNNKPRVENYDRADGMAVALYQAFLSSGKLTHKKPKVKKPKAKKRIKYKRKK